MSSSSSVALYRTTLANLLPKTEGFYRNYIPRLQNLTCSCTTTFNVRIWFSSVRNKLAHNLEVAGSNPVPATCFSSSETGRPQGYSKGRCQMTSAFFRFFVGFCAVSVRPDSRTLVLAKKRDPFHCHSSPGFAPSLAQTLTCL